MIIVTGASGKLGRKVIRLLKILHSDKKILAISRNEVIKGCDNLHLDLQNSNDSAEKLDRYLTDCELSVEALINCAGVCVNKHFLNQSLIEIERQISVNLISTISLSYVVLRHMQSGAHIINVSSLMGRIPMQHYSVYCSSKFGILGFSEALRLELQDSGINVSCVLPTLFRSKMTENVITPKFVQPIKAKKVAREIVSMLHCHSGVRTIGLQSELSLLLERFAPNINRIIAAYI